MRHRPQSSSFSGFTAVQAGYLNPACRTRNKKSRHGVDSPEHKAAALSHMESSKATAISNVIPAISTWPKMAMVNSIWVLVGVCLVPRQWKRCTKCQRGFNEGLPPTVTPPLWEEALRVPVHSVFVEERQAAQHLGW